MLYLHKLDVTTTNGQTFSGADHARMAALIFRRFGEDTAVACAAWRRLLGNSTTEADFAALAKAGADLLAADR